MKNIINFFKDNKIFSEFIEVFIDVFVFTIFIIFIITLVVDISYKINESFEYEVDPKCINVIEKNGGEK